MQELIQSLICCPDCNSTLYEHNDTIACEGCQATFALEDGIPLLFSHKILQDPLFLAYKRQYDEHMKELCEYNSKYIEYQAAGFSEKLRHFISDFHTARRMQHSTRKYGNYMAAGAQFVGPTSGLTILDIGSSEGLLLAALEGNRVAFDISPFNLKHVIAEDVIPVSGFAEKLPFKNEVFDRVICAALLEHVLKPEMIADEITRVLKPSGKVIIVVPFNENPEKLFELEKDRTKEPIVETQPRTDKKKQRPATLHLRNFDSIEDVTRFFPGLHLTRAECCFYKRKRRFTKPLKMLLRPFRWAPDSLKRALPSLFDPSLLQVEMTHPEGDKHTKGP